MFIKIYAIYIQYVVNSFLSSNDTVGSALDMQYLLSVYMPYSCFYYQVFHTSYLCSFVSLFYDQLVPFDFTTCPTRSLIYGACVILPQVCILCLIVTYYCKSVMKIITIQQEQLPVLISTLL